MGILHKDDVQKNSENKIHSKNNFNRPINKYAKLTAKLLKATHNSTVIKFKFA